VEPTITTCQQNIGEHQCGLRGWLTIMVLHQPYATQYHSLFTLISYFLIVFIYSNVR